MAAAYQSQLLAYLEAALDILEPASGSRLAGTSVSTRRSLLLTLLFLGVAGLRRTWDLRSYTGDGLALLAGRKQAYGYRHPERFLTEIAQAGGADPLTKALAQWTASLWPPSPHFPGSLPPAYYIDGHRKAVWSQTLIPRGLVGRRGAVLGCRALVLLHDEQGHLLLVTTHRGDYHLTVGLPAMIATFEQASGDTTLQLVIVDREGMSAEMLAQLAQEGRTIVTVLRADQFAGMVSFTEVGEFLPWRVNRSGKVIREVAPARYCLPLPDHPGEHLELQVALIRDLTRSVPLSLPPGEEAVAPRWDADLRGQQPAWWEEGWEATPLPVPPTEPRLIPVISTPTEQPVEAQELANIYFGRWPHQENAIRDWLIPLGIDTNHGYGHIEIANSEVTKQRKALERRLTTLRKRATAARTREARASKQLTRRREKLKVRGNALYAALNARQNEIEQVGVLSYSQRKELKAQKAAADAELEALRDLEGRAYTACNQEFAKCARYCQQQRVVLRQLEDLHATERKMVELDNRKDQIMTVLKVALSNVGMWARDQYFPVAYAQATWQRLLPFFELGGWVTFGTEYVKVELRPFHDQALNRDLAEVCTRVAEVAPLLPDGRHLLLCLQGDDHLLLDASERKVA